MGQKCTHDRRNDHFCAAISCRARAYASLKAAEKPRRFAVEEAVASSQAFENFVKFQIPLPSFQPHIVLKTNCPSSPSCAATATFSGRLHSCVGVRSFLLLAAVAQLAARFAQLNWTCGCVVAVNCRKYFAQLLAQLLILARRRVVLVMPRGVGGG